MPHKDKAVQLKVHAVHRNRSARKGAQDDVEKVGGNRCYRAEKDRRHADFINFRNDARLGKQVFKLKLNFTVFCYVKENRNTKTEYLPQYGCERRAPDTHFRERPNPEYQQRVEYHIEYGAGKL